jgi:hypothetical protein
LLHFGGIHQPLWDILEFGSGFEHHFICLISSIHFYLFYMSLGFFPRQFLFFVENIFIIPNALLDGR